MQIRQRSPVNRVAGLCLLFVGSLSIGGCAGLFAPGGNANAGDDPDAGSILTPIDPLEIPIEGRGSVQQEIVGVIVTLTATPEVGWVFDTWLGSTQRQNNPLTIIATDQTSLAARFLELADSSDPVDDCPDDPEKSAPGICGCGIPDADSDADGLLDCQDNCPSQGNADQSDLDGDGLGDACDLDDDGDGVADSADRCAQTPVNAAVDNDGCADAQVDTDLDGICNPAAPSEGPGLCSGRDNCPDVSNPDQADGDGNGRGDACENDTDEDGVANGLDACPSTASGADVDASGCADLQVDADGDGACDPGSQVKVPRNAGIDNCPGISNALQRDTDSDGAGDACDDDDDGDDVPDVTDLCPATSGDAIVDGAGCSDAQVDRDGDGYCNNAAPTVGPSGCTGSDNCLDVANPDQLDTDGDGIGDACDQPVCGNGLIEEGETCDPPCNECSATCQLSDPHSTVNWAEGAGIDPAGALLGVWGSGPDDVFVVGGTSGVGEVYHFDGTAWSPMTIPSVAQLIWVFGFAPDDVYAVGASGGLLHYNGATWSRINLGFADKSFWGIWGAAPDDMWIVGGRPNDGDPLMLRFNGESAVETTVILDAGQEAHTLFKVWGIGSRTLAVGQNGVIVEYDGTVWRQVPSGATQRFISLWGTSEDNIVAVGGDFGGQVAYFDGTDWKTTVDFGVAPLNAVFMTHPDRAVIGGLNGYKGSYRVDTDSFQQEDIFLFPPIHALWSDCQGKYYAVGGLFGPPYNGFFLERTSQP